MKPGKTTEASDLVIRIINELSVHDYLADGVWDFFKCARQVQCMSHFWISHFVLTAEMQDDIVGTIEIRENNHITLFCVEKPYRQRGIGKKLLRKALEICVMNNPKLSEVSVNALPSAVPIYEKLGFHTEKMEWMEYDIPYTPMLLDVSKMNNTIGIMPHH
jgi:predicted GNAT family N-acyltransferase